MFRITCSHILQIQLLAKQHLLLQHMSGPNETSTRILKIRLLKVDQQGQPFSECHETGLPSTLDGLVSWLTSIAQPQNTGTWDLDAFDSFDESSTLSEKTLEEVATLFIERLELARQALDKPVDWSFKRIEQANTTPKLDGDWQPLEK
jgi:hypothetical protein